MMRWDFEFVCEACREYFTSKARGKELEAWHAGKMGRRTQEVVDYHWAMRHPGPAFKPAGGSQPQPSA